jgi:hypothetical protein
VLRGAAAPTADRRPFGLRGSAPGSAPLGRGQGPIGKLQTGMPHGWLRGMSTGSRRGSAARHSRLRCIAETRGVKGAEPHPRRVAAIQIREKHYWRRMRRGTRRRTGYSRLPRPPPCRRNNEGSLGLDLQPLGRRRGLALQRFHSASVGRRPRCPRQRRQLIGGHAGGGSWDQDEASSTRPGRKRAQGAVVKARMSELPNVAGQFAFGAGFASGLAVVRLWR